MSLSADLQAGVQHFHGVICASQSANRDERQNATQYLESMILDQANTSILLQYIQSNQEFPEQCRQAAAIALKNKIKHIYGQHSFTHYTDRKNAGSAPDESQLPQDDPLNLIDNASVQILQQNLVSLMMNSTKKVAEQFLEIISLMGKRFIHIEWPTLVPEVLQCIANAQDPQITRLGLEAFKKICKKYRYMFRSDELYTEINYMIQNLSVTLMTQATFCVDMIKQSMGNLEVLQTLFSILNSIFHIIESFLGQEELPDFYEENLEAIATILSFILELQFDQTNQVPSQLIKCRAKVVRVVHVYQFKFNEHFQNYSQYFFDRIWGMVFNRQVPSNKVNEKLIHSIIRYLNEMSTYANLQEFFKQNMVHIFELIIIPNISITQEDIDEYEDDPDAYVRNDLEESDTDTRRRQCMKFLHSLSQKFQNEIANLIGEYVGNLMQQYSQNRNKEWLKMTTALNLIITASISMYTYKNGAESILISQEQLGHYLQSIVMPELEEQNINNLSVLKATCIKFIYMFRNQIPDELVPAFVGRILEFLKSESTVNQSYAAACIEKLLIRKSNSGNQGDFIFTPQNSDAAMIGRLLQNLCELLQNNKNLYAVRSLYRTVQLAQNNIGQFAQVLSEVLSAFINQAALDETQSSPNYLYILFETTALTLRYLKQDQATFGKVEEVLSIPLNYIIEKNIVDMIAYAFQIYTLFVANSTTLKPIYDLIAQSIINNSNNWGKDMKHLIPSMSTFLIAIIFRYPEFARQHINNILLILQQLINVDIRMEIQSLQIGSAVFEKLGVPNDQFLRDYLFSIFSTLHFYRNNTKNKTIPIPIIKAIWSFFANFIIYNGSQSLFNACNSIQNDILFMIMRSEGEKIKFVTSPARDRKYAIVAYSQFIQDYVSTIPDDVLQIVTRALVEICFTAGQSGFQVASTIGTDTEDLLQDGAIDQTFAFQRSTHVQLNAAKIDQTDKLAEQVQVPEVMMLNAFQTIQQAKNTNMSEIIGDDKHKKQLSQLCAWYNVPLN